MKHAVLFCVAWLAACSSSGSTTQTQNTDGGRDAESGPDSSDADASACPLPSAPACTYAQGAMVTDTLGACARHGAQIPVEHVVLLMQENRSFDHYLGHLRGNGQDDVDVAADTSTNLGDDGAPILWHHLDQLCIDDANHEWDGSHIEYGDGKNDGFVRANTGISDAEGKDPSGSRTMGFYDQRDLPFYYQLASTFSISDRYFCELLGPTFPNRLFYMASRSFGRVDNQLDVAPGPSIFGILTARNITWKVYQSDIAAGELLNDFSTDNTAPVAQFAADAAAGTLPEVAFIDPGLLEGMATQTSEHPPADVQVGQKFVYDQVAALLASPNWSTSAMFIVYDENGGLYDHVPPPAACPPDDTPPAKQPELGGFDRYGFRVPAYVVSPFAKRHYVSHVVHSHSSILRFLEAKFDLPALSKRDANSDAMLDMFDFENPPFATAPALTEPAVDPQKLADCVAIYGE